jgi:AcrR family transcriptional regulator
MADMPDGSRARLLTTAKRLFAERGLDGVSLREIVREAGIKHATAVQYHFGDREGLVKAILAPHEERVDTRRDAMLDEYEANGAPDCRSVAAMLVRPLARELEDAEGSYFLRIYAQSLQRAHGMYTDTGTSVWRWRRHADVFLPPGVADFHPRFSAITFTAVELARRAAEDEAPKDHPLFVSRVIDVVAAILQAPQSTETERLHAARAAGKNQFDDERIA